MNNNPNKSENDPLNIKSLTETTKNVDPKLTVVNGIEDDIDKDEIIKRIEDDDMDKDEMDQRKPFFVKKKPIFSKTQKIKPNIYNIQTTRTQRNYETQEKENEKKNEQIKDDKKNVNIVPNELVITIRTSIPGFQTIIYKPSMTIPNEKSSKVQFNPLVKLRKSVINSVPKEIQVKEFFNYGLFNSLINAHGLNRVPNLIEATYKGYVDNNINITLETLFPRNGVIYIANQPYAIADVLWKKGDWRINKKILQIPQFDIRRVSNPFLYLNVLKEQQSIGGEELNNLPPEVIFGQNYSQPIERSTTDVISTTPSTTPLPPSSPSPILPSQSYTPLAILPPPSSELSKPISPPFPAILPAPSVPFERNVNNFPLLPAPSAPPLEDEVKNFPLLPAPSAPPLEDKVKNLPLLPAPSNIEELEIIKPTFAPPVLKKNVKETATLVNYFKSINFYNMINCIYKNSIIQIKNVFNIILENQTCINIKKDNNLSKKAYEYSVEMLFINSTLPNGDCFFIAIKDAINYHNVQSELTDDLIIYDMYGHGNTPFTVGILREIVSDYVINIYKKKNSNEYKYLKQKILSNVNKSNEIFLDEVKNIDVGNVVNLINRLLTNSNEFYFGIKKNPNFEVSIPFTDNNVPFKEMNLDELTKFIKSQEYWADELSITALLNVLKLYIITIENRTKINNNNNRLISILPLTSNNSDDFKHYLFLYNKNYHYELICFNKIIRRLCPIKSNIYTTIFKNAQIQQKGINIELLTNLQYPPFYLIFLLYGWNFLKQDILDSQLLSFVFNQINSSFKSIINTADKINNCTDFLKNINNYFGLDYKVPPAKPKNKTIKALPGPITKYATRSKTMKNKETTGGAETSFVNSDKDNQKPSIVNSSQQNVINRLKQNYGSVNSPQNINNPLQQPISNLSYYITIDLELKKGTSLSSADLINLKCNQQFNKIRKNYAELRGLQYVIPPVYENLPNPKNSNDDKKLPNTKK